MFNPNFSLSRSGGDNERFTRRVATSRFSGTIGVKFWKLEASGNDFILLDNRDNRYAGLETVAKKLCRRRISVGADGLLVMEKARGYHFRMRIFNSDGSEAEMCGNGSRCIAFFAAREKIAPPSRIFFSTLAGKIEAAVSGKNVRVKLPAPSGYKKMNVKAGGRDIRVSFVNTGVPHAVLTLNKIDKIDVTALGSIIRKHRVFHPAGTNADFVQVLGRKRIRVRTYERGVEGETLSCGTGSVASAYVLWKEGRTGSPVLVETRGEILRVDIKSEEEVWLEGKVKLVYEGKIEGRKI
ncbi:MAG TPA: diaminopimelate epimerase [bacterium]|nr:diaminopimelate epimerase [bacterium]